MTAPSRATAYALAVLDGEIVAGELIRLAAQRHVDDLKRADLHYDQEEEDRLHAFYPNACQYLEPADLAGKPMELAPHQSFYFGQLRGWLKKDGAEYRHRFKRGLCLSGRGGAGKTTSLAGLILYHALILNGQDPKPEVYLTAQQHQQMYDPMDALWLQITRNDTFAGLFRRQLDHGHPLLVRMEDSAQFSPATIRRIALSSKAGEGVRGPKPSLLIVEEAQSVMDMHLLHELAYGAKNRPFPSVLWFGNAGHDLSTPLGVLFVEAQEGLREQHELDDAFLPAIYMSDRGEDLLDNPDEVIEEEVLKANPLFPISPRKGFVWDEVRAAQKNPARRNEVLNQLFGVWTSAATAWLPAEIMIQVESAQAPPPDSRLFLGLDLSKSGDMSAIGEFYEYPDGENGLLKGHCWLPAGGMENRSKADQSRFKEWAGEHPAHLDGPLTITPGRKISYASMVAYLQRLLDQYEVVGMAADSTYLADFRDALAAAGVPFCTQADQAQTGELIIVHHPQGIAGFQRLKEFNELSVAEQQKRVHAPLWFSRSLAITEEGLLEGYLLVEKQPLMRWTLQSVEIGSDTVGNRYVVRKPSTGGMIDLAVAGMMARGLADAWLDAPAQDNLYGAWLSGMQRQLAGKLT